MKQLFVVGCPRSGTTALQQALNRHSGIVIPPETSFLFLQGFPRWEQRAQWARINEDLGIAVAYPAAGFNKTPSLRAGYQRLVDAYLYRVGRGQPLYFGDKSPEHLLRWEQIHKVFPEASILLLYRDGRDVAASLRKLPWFFGDLVLGFLVWLRYCRVGEDLIASKSLRVRCVQYERLVRNSAQELREICGFLGLEYEHGMAEGAGSRTAFTDREASWKSSSLQRLNDARIEAWKSELTNCEVRTLECLGRTELCSLGYKVNCEADSRLPWGFLPSAYLKLLWYSVATGRYRVIKELGRQGCRAAVRCAGRWCNGCRA